MEVSGAGDPRTVETDYYPSSAISERRRWVEGNAGVSEAYAYRSDGLIAEMMRSGGAGNSKDQSYAYDLNGNRTLDERGSHAFNARDQLVLWQRGSDQPRAGTNVSYVLNGSGAIEREVDAGETTTYRYNGDRLLSVEDDQTRSDYFYDDFANVVQIATDSKQAGGTFPPVQKAPAPEKICDPEKWTRPSDTYYCYDEFERLIAAQGPSSSENAEKPARYVYDGLDRRDLKITEEGGTERVREYSYIGTSEALSRELRRDGQVATYDYSSSGERMGQRMRDGAGDAYHPYAKDANGSVEALEDEDGSIAQDSEYDYDPYGELDDPDPEDSTEPEEALSDEAKQNPFRFEGPFESRGFRRSCDLRERFGSLRWSCFAGSSSPGVSLRASG